MWAARRAGLAGGAWTALESQRLERILHQRLVPEFTVRAGEVIEPRPLEAPPAGAH